MEAFVNVFWKIVSGLLILIIAILLGTALAIFNGKRSAAQIAPQATIHWPTIPPTPLVIVSEKDTPIPTTIVQPTATSTATHTPSPTPTKTPSPTPTLTPTPRIKLEQIKAMGRLETIEYIIQTVIDIKTQPTNTWQHIIGVFGTDKILLIAKGNVVAGIDLQKIRQTDITTNKNGVTLWLPPPEIFYSRIDNHETYVYQREKGILSHYDKNLETQARMVAEDQILSWAKENGILKKAKENAITQLDNLLRSLGFTDIRIFVRSQ